MSMSCTQDNCPGDCRGSVSLWWDGDPDVVLDLQAVLAKTYEAGRYRERLRDDRPCVPPLSAETQAWADACLRAIR